MRKVLHVEVVRKTRREQVGAVLFPLGTLQVLFLYLLRRVFAGVASESLAYCKPLSRLFLSAAAPGEKLQVVSGVEGWCRDFALLSCPSFSRARLAQVIRLLPVDAEAFYRLGCIKAGFQQYGVRTARRPLLCVTAFGIAVSDQAMLGAHVQIEVCC